MLGEIQAVVRQAATKAILFLPHAVRQMARPERRIRRREVEQVVTHGAVIEDYLAIITAYLPDPTLWENDFRRRKR